MKKGIPVSVSLDESIKAENFQSTEAYNKFRLFLIAALSVIIAICISFIAKLLVYLINFFTHLFFFKHISISDVNPAANNLGIWVIIIPVIGGLIVGLMALFGSKAIRGHGIPEAMEQILTNQSRIKPSIMFLKPVSAAISIGTGGPFGAEGPIIATGGALGSTIGQLLKITHHERKILLTAGAAAGMSAIFGTPIAAILLAIELLLFEFSPRSFIPIALACITGAAGHHYLFAPGYAFPVNEIIPAPKNIALFLYSILGIIIGLFSVVATKIVYIIEDAFERLPFHWAWWPAIGGLAVGIIGYFSPRTLGVGYNNIIDIISGNLSLQILLSLLILKFFSWSIALGSGTSGGTLAPLLTIGGAAGALLGGVLTNWFPGEGINISLSAIVGMSAMFAGAARAFLTSIVFALESTGQTNALLPLLGACTSSYLVSFFMMENTIMTEKIARRGIVTPVSYQPDILEKIIISNAMNNDGIILSEENTIGEVREWLNKESDKIPNYFIISGRDGDYRGILSSSNLQSAHHNEIYPIATLVKRKNIFVKGNNNLRMAVELMAKENVDVLPVISEEKNMIIGILTYRDIISTYRQSIEEHKKMQPHISLKRQGLKILVHGQKIAGAGRTREK